MSPYLFPLIAECNIAKGHTQAILAQTNLIVVTAWTMVLYQPGRKSPYITVIGSTVVTKAPYYRLEFLCTRALLPTDRPSPHCETCATHTVTTEWDFINTF